MTEIGFKESGTCDMYKGDNKGRGSVLQLYFKRLGIEHEHLCEAKNQQNKANLQAHGQKQKKFLNSCFWNIRITFLTKKGRKMEAVHKRYDQYLHVHRLPSSCLSKKRNPDVLILFIASCR